MPQRRQLITEVPGPRSQRLLARHRAAVSAAVGVTLPVYVARAGGGVIVDVDGNSIIDLASGIAVTSVGNSAPRVVGEATRQAARFTHTCAMVTPYEGYVAVCEQLNRLTPGTHDKRSVLFNSGAEAVENAVKIARAYTGRPAVVVLDHAYHGRTNLTMALTAKSAPYKRSFGPFAPEVYRVPASYPFREPVQLRGEQAAERAINLINQQVGADATAALVVEPIQGEGGFVVPAPGFLARLAAFCRDTSIVFVADEVQTGFGRTGRWFACDHEPVVPDLVVTGKAIAGGLPLSGVTGRAEIMDAPHSWGLGGTFGGNPVACAAALGTIRTIEEEDLVTRAGRLGDLMLARLGDLRQQHPVIGEARGRGAMIAIELVRPGTTEPDQPAARALAAACHAAGVVVLTCGTFGNVLRLLPPLVIPESLLSEGLDVITESLSRVTRGR